MLTRSWPLRLLSLSSIRLRRIWHLVGRRKKRLPLLREPCLTGLIIKALLTIKTLLIIKELLTIIALLIVKELLTIKTLIIKRGLSVILLIIKGILPISCRQSH